MKVESVMPPAVSSVVLVVDDAPDTLRMLCDALAIEGYTVLVARDAIEALERFEMAAGRERFCSVPPPQVRTLLGPRTGDLHDWLGRD